MFRRTKAAFALAMITILVGMMAAIASASSPPPTVTINPSPPKSASHSKYDFENLDYAVGNSSLAGDVRGRYKIDNKPYGDVDVFASTKKLGVHKYLFVVLRNNTQNKYAATVIVTAVKNNGETWLLDLREARPDGTKPAGYTDVILDAKLTDPHHPVQLATLDFADPGYPPLKYVHISVHVHPVADRHNVSNAIARAEW